MSQQYCYVCSGFDFDFDEEIGAMRCSNCFTLSQTFQEHNTEDMVGVTVIGTHNAAVLGFVREKDTSRKEREAAEMEEKRQRITSTVPEEEVPSMIQTIVVFTELDFLQLFVEFISLKILQIAKTMNWRFFRAFLCQFLQNNKKLLHCNSNVSNPGPYNCLKLHFWNTEDSRSPVPIFGSRIIRFPSCF